MKISCNAIPCGKLLLIVASLYFVSIAEVKMPSGKIDQPRIEDNHDGTVSVQYDPREDGIHELYVKYNGEHVQGNLHIDLNEQELRGA